MSKNSKLRSKERHRMTNSPEPTITFDWDNMSMTEAPKIIHVRTMPSTSAIIAALFFIVLIFVLIYI